MQDLPEPLLVGDHLRWGAGGRLDAEPQSLFRCQRAENRAGHLPPVVVRRGTARTLRLPEGMLLGAGPDACYEEATIRLKPGDALLMFTDGLIERRDQSIDDALHALTLLASRPVHDIGTFADHLLARSTSDTGDDACLAAVAVQ